jgi:hypothetical protein
MLVLSFDIGIVNLGMCMFDSNLKKILHAETLSLVERRADIKSEIDFEHLLFKHVFNHNMFNSAEMVIIERQMRRDMVIIQHIIATMAILKSKPVEFISPQSVKIWFRKLLSIQRVTKKKGRGVNHKSNKREALTVFRKLFPENTAIIEEMGKQDDIADAALQAAYWSSKKQKTSKKPAIKKYDGTMSIG